jgi:hypothetical protein
MRPRIGSVSTMKTGEGGGGVVRATGGGVEERSAEICRYEEEAGKMLDEEAEDCWRQEGKSAEGPRRNRTGRNGRKA